MNSLVYILNTALVFVSTDILYDCVLAGIEIIRHAKFHRLDLHVFVMGTTYLIFQ